ncbi:MAG: hypothetical protein ACYC9O_14870, partial [Candidatus Latescibacterota bacterium]
QDGCDRAVFDIRLPRNSIVKVDIRDERGRTVDWLLEGKRGPGNHQALWDRRAPSGRRLAHMTTEGRECVEPFEIV